MKLSGALSLVLLSLPFVAQAAVVPRSSPLQARQGAGNRNNNGGGGNGGGNNNGGANNNGDPQTSLTLDPSVIQPNLANDGLVAGAEAGQVASLTTTNNFINFCVGKTLTNGQQVRDGSCNPTPMGDIVPQSNMPSGKFQNPPNLGTVAANQAFTVELAVQNMVTGNFVNPQTNYFGAPQQLQGNTLIAHSHVVIEQIDSIESTQVTNPTNFAFFKGLNAPANNGVLTANVDKGLPAGAYRMCSINTAANHQPALVAVAQHGSLDDCVYFTSQ